MVKRKILDPDCLDSHPSPIMYQVQDLEQVTLPLCSSISPHEKWGCCNVVTTSQGHCED